jgi:hypothetical protein
MRRQFVDHTTSCGSLPLLQRTEARITSSPLLSALVEIKPRRLVVADGA